MTLPDDVNLKDYRACVGMCIFNPEGQVFYGARYFPNNPKRLSWQWPQGGIDPGETAEEAMFRELQEEVGLHSNQVEILSCLDDWLTYDIPGSARSQPGRSRWKGQKQFWFALRFDGRDSAINLESGPEIEFTHWRWGNLTEGPSLIIDFKRPVYEKVVLAFSPLI